MPRKPREVSESGFYHITQRGNARTLIFESDDDRRQFLRILKRLRDEMSFRVIAWVLMDDHFHLVVDAHNVDLSTFMHRLERAYVSYFNRIHERDGHLFQGSFFSRPIKTAEQLAATVHYVHQNPEAARICRADEYRWSSLQEYLGKHFVVDTACMLDYFGGLDGMLGYVGDVDEVVLSYGGKRCMGDAEVLELAKDLLGPNALRVLRSSERFSRNRAIRALSRNRVPKSQIARLSALGVQTVSEILSERG